MNTNKEILFPAYENLLKQKESYEKESTRCDLWLFSYILGCGVLKLSFFFLHQKSGVDTIHFYLWPLLINVLCFIYCSIPKLDQKMEIHAHLADTIIDGMDMEEKMKTQEDKKTFTTIVKNFSWMRFLFREGVPILAFTLLFFFLPLQGLLSFMWPSLKAVWMVSTGLLSLFIVQRFTDIICFPFMFVLNKKYTSDGSNTRRKSEQPNIKEWMRSHL